MSLRLTTQHANVPLSWVRGGGRYASMVVVPARDFHPATPAMTVDSGPVTVTPHDDGSVELSVPAWSNDRPAIRVWATDAYAPKDGQPAQVMVRVGAAPWSTVEAVRDTASASPIVGPFFTSALMVMAALIVLALFWSMVEDR